MAGGIDWFRWHHGSVSDSKFALVAHKAGASVAEVIAMWACLLESASASEDRGNPGEPDFEALDFSLGMAEGKARRIYERMRERALLDGSTGRIASWEKRQPKREDDTAAERKRRQREREHELSMAACVTESESRGVTHGHDRGEESREEKKNVASNNAVGGPRPAVEAPPTFSGESDLQALNGKHIVPLATGWELPESWGIDAEALGWKTGDVLREAEKFRQYWTAGRGAGTRRSVKGWRQSWSNWLEKAATSKR